jgi:hypothetical protein
MKHYFRIQQEHRSLSEMKRFNSGDGGDGNSRGLCATETVGELLRNTAFCNFGSAEIVVLTGEKIATIYDGVRIRPTGIVATFSYDEFIAKVRDGSIYDLETF